MPDPASWLVVDRGWDVIDAEGNHVGKVEEIVGDSTRDIFNGITVATGLFARGHYVAAEDVAEITEGEVRLRLHKDDVEQLPEYTEPPPSERILPE